MNVKTKYGTVTCLGKDTYRRPKSMSYNQWCEVREYVRYIEEKHNFAQRVKDGIKKDTPELTKRGMLNEVLKRGQIYIIPEPTAQIMGLKRETRNHFWFAFYQDNKFITKAQAKTTEDFAEIIYNHFKNTKR